MKLHWQKHRDPIFGPAQRLVGLPAADCANAYRSNGRYVATAHIGGRFMLHKAATIQAAIKRLNAEIDRRSIGLLGVDVVEFAP